jgi:4-amino-4-deoxy-L-arabinose transferase-like glycosyltransferase
VKLGRQGWGVLAGVALVSATLFLTGLGRAPLIDPSEGMHVQIAREMSTRGDWVTPHFNGVRYFDKPPLLYWLLAAGFGVTGPAEWAARLWPALAALGAALLTAWLGAVVGSPRLGLIAGLVLGANLELFIFARHVRPDLPFIFLILAAFAAFIVAYRGGGRPALFLCYAALGLAVLAKDLLGAVGPLAAIGLFLVLTREPAARARWAPGAALALLLAIAAPWHLAVEFRNRGFLWYMIVDNHVLNFFRQRAFPDEDVPLTALEFLGVTALGFFPWSLMLPWALARALGRPWQTPEARVWLLLGLWATLVLGFFTLSPFKLPHYALPAFPAMALLVARLWEDVLDGVPGAPSPRTLLLPPAVILAGLAGVSALAWRGEAPLPTGTLSVVDLYARNVGARGQSAPFPSYAELQPLLGTMALIFGAGAVALAVAAWRRLPRFGLGALLAVMLAFLPVTVEGLALFSAGRSVKGAADLLRARAAPGDVIAHEGSLENSGALFFYLGRPAQVRVVEGMRSTLAFGATFPGGREVFWDRARLAERWRGPERVFLLSALPAEASLVRDLDPASVHLLLATGGRRLYSNRP